MSDAALDPYAVLGVKPDISDIELRRVYRGLVKRHHPDHNGGAAESAARFAQIQSAYAAIAQRRRGAAGAANGAPGPGPQPATANPATPHAATQKPATANPATPHAATQKPATPKDPRVEDRIATLEREMAAVREAEERRMQEQARLVREQAAKLAAARRAQATQSHRLRATPEELGYYTTDDSFTKIVDDATEQLGERLRKSDAKKQFARRLSDLFGRDD